MALYASEISGVPARLPIGAEGRVLQVVSGAPSWEIPNPGQVKGHSIPDGGNSGQALRLAADGTFEWYTPSSGGSGGTSGGLTNPMSAAGDLIVGVAATTTNLTAQDSGVVMLTDTRAAPYWRVLATGSTLGYQWYVSTLELHIGEPDGTPARLGVGNTGESLTSLYGRPMWMPPVAYPLDIPPSSPHAKDDEFPGTALNAKWSAISSGANLQWTTTVAGGWLVAEPGQGGTASTGKRLMGIRQNAPSGAFTLSAKLASTYRAGDTREGIFVAEGTRINICGPDLGNGYMVSAIGSNSYSETADTGGYDGFWATGPNYRIPATIWVRIQWVIGGTLTFSYSLNGVLWTAFSTRSSMNQPTRIGLCQYSQNSAVLAADHQLACDFFRVTEP